MERNHTRVDTGISTQPHPGDLSTLKLRSELSGGLRDVHFNQNHPLSGEPKPWHRGGCGACHPRLYFSSLLSFLRLLLSATNYEPSRPQHSPPASSSSDSPSPVCPSGDQDALEPGLPRGLLCPPLSSTFDATKMMPLSLARGGHGFVLARRGQREQ